MFVEPSHKESELRRGDMVPLPRSSIVSPDCFYKHFARNGAARENGSDGQSFAIDLDAFKIAERGECDLLGREEFPGEGSNVVHSHRLNIPE